MQYGHCVIIPMIAVAALLELSYQIMIGVITMGHTHVKWQLLRRAGICLVFCGVKSGCVLVLYSTALCYYTDDMGPE